MVVVAATCDMITRRVSSTSSSLDNFDDGTNDEYEPLPLDATDGRAVKDCEFDASKSRTMEEEATATTMVI
jgi:hypothetical protein